MRSFQVLLPHLDVSHFFGNQLQPRSRGHAIPHAIDFTTGRPPVVGVTESILSSVIVRIVGTRIIGFERTSRELCVLLMRDENTTELDEVVSASFPLGVGSSLFLRNKLCRHLYYGSRSRTSFDYVFVLAKLSPYSYTLVFFRRVSLSTNSSTRSLYAGNSKTTDAKVKSTIVC